MIPLTVIGGFLGAGKTTLVNHLLASAARRWGVLVNDFGQLNVDAALIAANDGRTMALTNGCACCSIGDDFGEALHRMAALGPEHIVVEASGVADPWRIAQLALVEPGFALEPIVVVVDAAALAGQLADRWVADTVRGQLTYAELVVLNKADLAGAEAMAAARAALPARARVVTAVRGVVDWDCLQFTAPERTAASRFAADAPHPFVTRLCAVPAGVERERLRAMLGALPGSVLRIKGVVRLGNEDVLLQYAAERWAFTPAPTGLAPGLVVIGTPEMPDVASLLAGCVA